MFTNPRSPHNHWLKRRSNIHHNHTALCHVPFITALGGKWVIGVRREQQEGDVSKCCLPYDAMLLQSCLGLPSAGTGVTLLIFKPQAASVQQQENSNSGLEPNCRQQPGRAWGKTHVPERGFLRHLSSKMLDAFRPCHSHLQGCKASGPSALSLVADRSQ